MNGITMDKKLEQLALLIKAVFPNGIANDTRECFYDVLHHFREILGFYDNADNVNAVDSVPHIYKLDSDLFAEIIKHVDLPDKTTRKACAKHIICVLERDTKREEELKRLNVAMNAISRSGAQDGVVLARYANRAINGEYVWVEGSIDESIHSGDKASCKT